MVFLSDPLVALLTAVCLAAFSASLACGSEPDSQTKRFYIQNDQFMKDEQSIVIRSGSLHYFRVPPPYWRDRILRMKALGLNTITTYVAWNFHEEVEGQIHDLEMVGSFLDQAHAEGMMVILRPGPYICGEWEFGGLPSFLLAKEGIKLRTYNAAYLQAVDSWLNKLYANISSKAYSKGGPVIAIQIENEYGSYGDCENNPDDAKYMEYLYSLAHYYFGPDILYTTVDGGEDHAVGVLQRGTPWANNPKVFAAIDGTLSTDYSKKFAEQKKFNAPGNSPKMWCELWVGWFTVWGDAYAANKSAFTDPDYKETSFLDGVGAMVEEGASFSLYMAHGGTNFGFWSGANGNVSESGPESFKPDITSYDYSSPISEAGDHNVGKDGGDLFLAVQQAITSKYGKAFNEPAPIAKAAYGSIALTQSAPLFANVDALQTCNHTLEGNDAFPTFEDLGQAYGFMLYSRTSPSLGSSNFSKQILEFNSQIVHDRVQVFVDGSLVGVAYRRQQDSSVSVPEGSTMDLLVENMGRINYGLGMYDYKGLLMKPPVDGIWKAHCLPLGSAAVRGLNFSSHNGLTSGQPVFKRGLLKVHGTPKDTFLDTDGLTKGLIWVNGYNLGRFWATVGPQYTLYVPAPYLNSGDNEVIIFDLEGSKAKQIISVAVPRYSTATSPMKNSMTILM